MYMMQTTKSWTDGTRCERSNRRVIEPVGEKEKEVTDSPITKICNTLDNQIMSNCETIHSRDTNNRREDTYIKIASREMFNKINQNPFLLGNNYVNDIINQDQYLKPIREETNSNKFNGSQ